MNRVDTHIWIAYLATIGCCLAALGYLHEGNDASQQFIFQIANSLISGALGAFTAMKGSASPGPGETLTTTQSSSSVNPTLPVEPASTSSTK
jgi:hypothetical protein